MKKVSPGETLQEVVWQALEQERLTCGVQDCAHLLEIDPYSVMVCLLPDTAVSSPDVSLHIHHMLIEAFCREYDIRLVKVDSPSKMSELVKGRDTATDNCVKVSRAASSSDTSCILVQYPDDGSSEEDETLAEHYQQVTYSDSSHTCSIALPD